MKERVKIHPDVVIAIISIIFATILIKEIGEYPADVKMFPMIFIYIFIMLMIIILIGGIKKTIKPDMVPEAEWWVKMEVLRSPLITAAFVIIYVALITVIGFYIATLIYLLIAMRFFGEKRWKVNIGVTIGLVVFCYILFDIALSVTLPIGKVFELLGF